MDARLLPLRLAKRSHGGQRVHIVPPLHNLAVPDSNDRDEPVVVGCAGSDNRAGAPNIATLDVLRARTNPIMDSCKAPRAGPRPTRGAIRTRLARWRSIDC